MDLYSGTLFYAVHIKYNGTSAPWGYSADSLGLGKRSLKFRVVTTRRGY